LGVYESPIILIPIHFETHRQVFEYNIGSFSKIYDDYNYYYRQYSRAFEEKFILKNAIAAQSRQSAKRFSSRWNCDSPTPLAAGECAPPPFGPGGRAHSLAAKGVGEYKFQRGDIHCGALYI